MVDGRTNNAKSIIAALRSTLGGSVRVFDTEIPRSVRAAEASGEGKSIFTYDPKSRVAQAYIRLTHLIPSLLDLVDSGKIAFRPAVELSYLTEEEQNGLLDSINSEQSTPSLAQALKMKEFSQNGRLNADVILSIMCEQKPKRGAGGTVPVSGRSPGDPGSAAPSG